MKRYLYFAPAAALLGGVLALPLAIGLARGTGHWGALFRDAALPRIALTTLSFAGASVVLELGLGLAFALLLHRTFRLRGPVRAAALVPWALPTAVMAMSWRWIFNDTYGLANDLAVRLGVLERGIAWLGRPGTAFAAIVVADVWKTTPFVTLLLLAGLQSIPEDLYEALSLDGAGPILRFRMVTLPLLRPALALAVAFRLIQALGAFDLVWVLTGGGPADATRTIALYIYDQQFRYLDSGYAAALTGAFGLATLALAAGVGRWVRGSSAS
ncbi:MAG: sugar ABC transporter permease [Planctomycetes bacterium]|nr:sugar ABC transporter permease [Planctomycetota bacterium]